MKKTICFYGVWIAIMFAMEGINLAILLNIHPTGYYFTLDGLRTVLAMVLAEVLIIAPLFLHTEKKYMG